MRGIGGAPTTTLVFLDLEQEGGGIGSYFTESRLLDLKAV
jgi:hypothetical protein